MIETEIINQELIQSKIFTIRGKQVMMDKDLGEIYGVETRTVNQAVKRNQERFPEKFMFQLTKEEFETLRSQSVISKEKRGGVRYFPTVFTEQGVAMLSAVLRSETAVKVSIQIMTAFFEMRKLLKDNGDVVFRIENIERKQLKTEDRIDKIFTALESNQLKPKQGVFYDGQVFDAYTFIADIIRSAKTSIVLIDNYIDDTVLRLFTKRGGNVSLIIYTQKISAQLALDLMKHNMQYNPALIKEFKNAHDRFLIIDNTTVYHIGASLKDLGRKWFAFSKMDIAALGMLSRLQ